MIGYLKKGCPVVLSILFPIFLQSQNALGVAKEKEPPFTLNGSAKVSLFDMVDPIGPVFGLAFEQKIATRLTAQLEAGYLTTFDGRYLLPRDLEGYKIRGELRIYEKEGFNLEGVSYGLQVMYKNDHAHETGEFQRAGGSFFQTLNYEMERKVIAAHFVTNVMYPFNEKYFLEISAWVGIRRLNRSHKGVPEDADLVDDFRFFVSREVGTFLRPSLGVALRTGLGW